MYYYFFLLKKKNDNTFQYFLIDVYFFKISNPAKNQIHSYLKNHDTRVIYIKSSVD